MTIRPAVVIKDQQEVTHLKQIIARLTTQLQHYQHLAPPPETIPDTDDLVFKMMSGHMLAPLFKEYEATIMSQKTEITSLRFELQKSLD